MSHNLDEASAPKNSHLSREIPPSAKGLWPAWTAVGVLCLAVSWMGYFRYNSVIGTLPTLHVAQDNVLLFAVPSSFALISGMVLALRPQLSFRARFWTAAVCFLAISLTALARHPSFVPLYMGDWGIMPNFAGLGIAAATAFAGAELSFAMERGMRGEFPRRMLVSGIAGCSLAIMAVSAYFMAPYISIEQRKAPAMLGDNYRLVWEKAFPLKGASLAAGFWFPSQQRTPAQGSSSADSAGLGSGLPLDEDAFLLTEAWIGRIRLRDGTVVWGTDFDFGRVNNETAAFAVYFDDERVYVINRSLGWSVFAFDWASGDLLWRFNGEGVERAKFDNPRLTFNVTREFIVMTAEDGKPEYDVIDPKTGAATRRSLPVPQGMVLAEVPSMKAAPYIGPYLVEGSDGTIAVLAYFSPAGVTVPEEVTVGEPLTDKGYLFGLDPATGEVAWKIEDVGDWRTPGSGLGKDLWVTDDLAIRAASYPDFRLSAWDTTSGQLIWSREFGETADFVISPLGVIAFHDETALECFDIRTGERRWYLENLGQSWPLGLLIEGETLLSATARSIVGRRMSDGSELFRVDAQDGSRLGEYAVSGGILKVEVRQEAGSGLVDMRLIDLAMGSEVSPDPYQFSPTRGISERYLFALRPGDVPGRVRTLGGVVPVFKVQGYAAYLPIGYGTKEPLAEAAAGGFMAEGWMLLSSWDYSAGLFHMYMIGPAKGEQ